MILFLTELGLVDCADQSARLAGPVAATLAGLPHGPGLALRQPSAAWIGPDHAGAASPNFPQLADLYWRELEFRHKAGFLEGSK